MVLIVDKMSRKPIYEQIIDGIKREIVMGIIPEQTQLPSIRELSAILATNPNTVQKAFVELDRDGIIVSSPGRGCFVADGAKEKIRSSMASKIDEICAVACELANAGIDKQTIINAIESAYSKDNC